MKILALIGWQTDSKSADSPNSKSCTRLHKGSICFTHSFITDLQNSLLDSVGEGKGGMIWGNVMETCIISYKKRITSPGSIQDPWLILLSTFLYPASNLDWRFVSHMILYTFQCHSPKSSHPFPLPQSPKDCFIHLCLFWCLAYRVIITIFLNSIYMHQYTVLVFFFLAYFTLYNRLQFHPPHQN